MSAHVSSLIHVSFWLPYLGIQTERKDLLQLMLDASQVSPQLEEGHVLINSLGVLLAGHETTSSALTFASYLLALNPKVQDKLAEEVSSYLQENPVSPHQCPNSVEVHLVINFSSPPPPLSKHKTMYEAAQEVEYLDMVIQETLRMYSPGGL